MLCYVRPKNPLWRKREGKNHNLMVQHGRVCLNLSQNFQSIIHTKRKYKCKGQGCCLERNLRIGIWIWSNEVKNLTWLVNSSIMYEPPQIVCVAPLFCTRKPLQKHCYLPGMKTIVLKWFLLQYNLMVKVYFLTIRFSRFII